MLQLLIFLALTVLNLTRELFKIDMGTKYSDECVNSLIPCDEAFQSPSGRHNSVVLLRVLLNQKNME